MERSSFVVGVGLALAFAVAASACSTANSAAPGNGSDAGAAGASNQIPCDVDAVLESNCRKCHAASPLYGAPMPLVTWGDLHAASSSDPTKKVYELISARVHDDAKPMPPPPNARLGESDGAVLAAWIGAGAGAAAPETTCGPGGGTTPPATVKPLSCNVDVHMEPTGAWEMPESTDDEYVCYGFDVTNDKKRHLIGIAPKIQNPAIVHHLVLFQSDKAISGKPAPCPMSNSMNWRIVYGWAPGGGNFEFPPEAGYPQEATTHYVVQVHYNNIGANKKAGQKDASGFDFCTTSELRPNDADSLVFGTTSISIKPRSTLDLSCDMTVPAGLPPIHVFAAFPHMHQLGTTISTTKLGGEQPIDLGTQASWDFQNQVYFPINATLSAGDKVRTRCAWKNTGSSSVSFGERTQDEMCFSFTMYWPRITAPQWNWMAPTSMAKCTPTQQ